MGMLVNGIWHQEDPPRAELGMTGSDGKLCAPGLGVFRDRGQSRRLVRLQGRGGRYMLVTAPSCPWGASDGADAQAQSARGHNRDFAIRSAEGRGWAYSRGWMTSNRSAASSTCIRL